MERLIQTGGGPDLHELMVMTNRRFARVIEREISRGFRVADIDRPDGSTVVYMFKENDDVNAMAKVYRFDHLADDWEKSVVTRWEFDILRRLFEGR